MISKEEILSYIKISDNDCWEMTKNIMKTGYGFFRINKKKYLAHRISFEVFNGYIEKEKHVCHSCDNRKCINPKHLWLGTDLDNIRDMVKKGRHKNQNKNKLLCKNGHEFSLENTRIYEKNGKKHRICIICEKNYHKQKYLIKTNQLYLKEKTHCKRGHEWVDENIYIRPDGEKNCKVCRKINRALRYSKLKK